jgi:hypothetical protein
LHLHKADWEKNNSAVAELIYADIQSSELHFYGKYPGKYCGVTYDILTQKTRAIQMAYSLEKLNDGILLYNEPIPDSAFLTEIVSPVTEISAVSQIDNVPPERLSIYRKMRRLAKRVLLRAGLLPKKYMR